MPPESEEAVSMVFLDAGIFIGALLVGDPRHAEARHLVELARRGDLQACTTAGVLSEVYGALTWERAEPQHAPDEAAEAVALLIEPPSAIQIVTEDGEVALLALRLAARHRLSARRIHDARHAASALVAGVTGVFTYDVHDWRAFASDGLVVIGPASVLRQTQP